MALKKRVLVGGNVTLDALVEGTVSIRENEVIVNSRG